MTEATVEYKPESSFLYPPVVIEFFFLQIILRGWMDQFSLVFMCIYFDFVTVHIDFVTNTPGLTVGHLSLDDWHTVNFNVMSWKTSATNIFILIVEKKTWIMFKWKKNEFYLTVFQVIFNHKCKQQSLWWGSFAYEYYIRWHSVHFWWVDHHYYNDLYM